MRVPQVSERIKEAPAQALRGVFAGIGQLLLITDKLRNKTPADQDVPRARTPEAPAKATVTSPAGQRGQTATAPAEPAPLSRPPVSRPRPSQSHPLRPQPRRPQPRRSQPRRPRRMRPSPRSPPPRSTRPSLLRPGEPPPSRPPPNQRPPNPPLNRLRTGAPPPSRRRRDRPARSPRSRPSGRAPGTSIRPAMFGCSATRKGAPRSAPRRASARPRRPAPPTRSPLPSRPRRLSPSARPSPSAGRRIPRRRCPTTTSCPWRRCAPGCVTSTSRRSGGLRTTSGRTRPAPRCWPCSSAGSPSWRPRLSGARHVG